jgi:hypothetical protein
LKLSVLFVSKLMYDVITSLTYCQLADLISINSVAGAARLQLACFPLVQFRVTVGVLGDRTQLRLYDSVMAVLKLAWLGWV